MSNLFHLKERILAIVVGVPRFLGKGYWRKEYITLTDLALNPCQIYERNHVKLFRWLLWGFIVGYELPFL
jgi:hypothetical protein